MIESRLAEKRLGIVDIKEIAAAISCERLYELMMGDDLTTARNAAWALRHKPSGQLATLQPHQQQMVDLVLRAHDIPLQRLVLSILELQTWNQDSVRSDLLDFCLHGMKGLEYPPGVQALCMKLAFRLCSFWPELLQELYESLCLMELDGYSPGLKCTHKKTIKAVESLMSNSQQ